MILLRSLAVEYALHLFHWFWQSALVAALALAIVRWAPRSSARFRSTVLALAVWKFFLPPMLPAPSGGFSRFGVFGYASLKMLPQGILLLILLLALVHTAGAVWRWRALGSAARAWRRLPGRSRARGRMRLVIAAPGIELPAAVAFGWLRPTIVVSADVWFASTRAERSAVLAHERAHLRRLHGLLVPWEQFLGALAWLHPLVHPTLEAHRRVREELCDRDAVRSFDGDAPGYASALVKVAALCSRRARLAAASAAVGSEWELARRITALGRRSRWSAAESVVALVLWLVLLPGLHPPYVHAPHSPSSPPSGTSLQAP